MKLVCPSCHATHSAEAWASDADARLALLIAAELPADLGAVAIRYLGLFRTGARGLSWPRARKLLEEIAAMLKAGSIRRNGRDWPISVSGVRAAMQRMVDRRDSIDGALDGHGYLLKILADEADKVEKVREREVEATRQAGRHANLVDEAEADRTFQQNCRTAKAMVVNEQTVRRTRFREEYPAGEARDFLRGRGFATAVVSAVIADVYGPSA